MTLPLTTSPRTTSLRTTLQPIEVVGLIYHSGSTEVRSLPPSTFDKQFITTLAQSYDRAGFDRVLIGQTATWPDNLAMAAFIAAHTENLKFMIAQRPGFIAPSVAARKLATIDQLSGGRAGVHIITAASDIETQCDGDFLTKDERYVRSHEYVQVLRKMWAGDGPVSHHGKHFVVEGARADIKPANGHSIPVFWGGTSPLGVKLGAEVTDTYALGAGTIADTAAQIAAIKAEADKHGRTLRYSMSMRIVLDDSDDKAWGRANKLLGDIVENQARHGLVGRVKAEDHTPERLAKFSAMPERLDDCLWQGVTKVTQGRLHATALVGAAETIVKSLLKYRAVGVTNFLLTGFEPIADTVRIGADIIPLLRRSA
jgi:alkanesulfonate monooxygenase